jgi:hypothetical protein
VNPLPLAAICHVKQEHRDNGRFLKDREKWFGVPITVLSDLKYGGSVVTVIRRERFINSKNGATCTKLFKKLPGTEFLRFGDLDVFGDTAEEQARLDRMIDGNNGIRVLAPLINGGLDEGACLSIV